MELRKIISSLLLSILLQISAFAFNFEIWPEGYDFYPIIFENNENCTLVSEEFFINAADRKIQKKVVINNLIDEDINCKIDFFTHPESGSCVDKPYPVDYEIKINDQKTTFKFINDGKEIKNIEFEDVNTCYDAENSFVFIYPAKKGNNTIVVEYTADIYRSIISFDSETKKASDYFAKIYFDMKNSNLFISDVRLRTKDGFKLRFDMPHKYYLEDLQELNITKEKDIIILSNIEKLEDNLFLFDFYGFLAEGPNSFYFRKQSFDYAGSNMNLQKNVLDIRDFLFMTPNQLKILRNAFYAFHGYNFKSEELRQIFSEAFYGYYKINPNFSESDFNEIERKNIELIKEMENLKNPILLSEFLEEK